MFHSYVSLPEGIYTGWWFGRFFIFHNIWDNPSHWRTHIFQDGHIAPPTSWVTRMVANQSSFPQLPLARNICSANLRFQNVPMLIKLPRGVQQTCLNQPWCWLTSVTWWRMSRQMFQAARFVAGWFPCFVKAWKEWAKHKPRAKHELFMCPCPICMTFWKAIVLYNILAPAMRVALIFASLWWIEYVDVGYPYP